MSVIKNWKNICYTLHPIFPIQKIVIVEHEENLQKSFKFLQEAFLATVADVKQIFIANF